MSMDWRDYTIRVRVGSGKRAHLAIAGGNYTACGLVRPRAGATWRPWVSVPNEWPVCQHCQDVLDDARRAEEGDSL